MSIKSILLLLSLLCGLVASAKANHHLPRLMPVACPADLRALAQAESANIECAELLVLEDRLEPQGAVLSLFSARVKAGDDQGNPPLLYLAGGPGDAASSAVSSWLAARMHEARDIIFFDQRGSGRSQPALNCPEVDSGTSAAKLIECRDRLLASGIKLSAFSSEAIAQDIADLIKVQDQDAIDIYGHSYGARLALDAAARAPERIRALVLDGALASGVNALENLTPGAARAMRRLIDDCGANAACNDSYPQLQSQLEQVISDLKAEPVEIDGLIKDAALRLDGADLIRLLRDLLVDAANIDVLPALIAALAEESYSDPPIWAPLRFYLEPDNADAHSEGLYMNVFCADVAANTTVDKIVTSGESLPSMYAPLTESAIALLQTCAAWLDAGKGSRFSQPARLDKPALLLSGRYDPNANLSESADRFARAWRLEFSRLGHSILPGSDCARIVTERFLSNPYADPIHSCLAQSQPVDFRLRKSG